LEKEIKFIDSSAQFQVFSKQIALLTGLEISANRRRQDPSSILGWIRCSAVEQRLNVFTASKVLIAIPCRICITLYNGFVWLTEIIANDSELQMIRAIEG